MIKSGDSFKKSGSNATEHFNGTLVELGVGVSRQTQSDLDSLTLKLQQEALKGEPSSTRIEELSRAVLVQKKNFESILMNLLSSSGLRIDQPICFCIYKGRIKLTDATHSQASSIQYLLSKDPAITENFIRLEQQIRVVEIGRLASAAYGDWKQSGDTSGAQNLTKTSIARLRNISGACLHEGKLSLLLDGQAQKQLSFHRKFHFSE